MTLILAHGAGAPMDSEWMNELSENLNHHKIQVLRFEFPYMQERRHSGKKRPPNPAKALEAHWLSVIEHCHKKEKPLFIGGKSMGGRVASRLADQVGATGLICFGFPFHAPGKPLGDRSEHLKHIETPTLIIQGTRDSMGTKENLRNHSLSKRVSYLWLEDGDHSFKPRKSSGFSLHEHLKTAAQEAHEFMSQLEHFYNDTRNQIQFPPN